MVQSLQSACYYHFFCKPVLCLQSLLQNTKLQHKSPWYASWGVDWILRILFVYVRRKHWTYQAFDNILYRIKLPRYSINKYKIQTLIRIVVLNPPCLWQYCTWYLNPTFGLNSCQLWSLLEILHSAKKSGNTSCFAGSESISKPTSSTLLDMTVKISTLTDNAYNTHITETLPKAQRTRGLSSSFQSKELGPITSSNTNLDQTSSSKSRPSIYFKISTKHHHLD